MKSFRTAGVKTIPLERVRFPFTTTQEETVSLVELNQSLATKDDTVVDAFRAVTSYVPAACEFSVKAPPLVGVMSDPA